MRAYRILSIGIGLLCAVLVSAVNVQAADDLIVVARSANKVASRPVVEAALFGTGCPVLIAPPEPLKIVGEHVMIGWNKSAPSARAVRYAMPFWKAPLGSSFLWWRRAPSKARPHTILLVISPGMTSRQR